MALTVPESACAGNTKCYPGVSMFSRTTPQLEVIEDAVDKRGTYRCPRSSRGSIGAGASVRKVH